MELVKNKVSGKLFIVLGDAEEKFIQLITPEGCVKKLERSLFGPLTATDNRDCDLTGDLTHEQIHTYRKYSENIEY